MEIRRSYRLISTMRFPILVRCHIYIELGPRSPLLSAWGWQQGACPHQPICQSHYADCLTLNPQSCTTDDLGPARAQPPAPRLPVATQASMLWQGRDKSELWLIWWANSNGTLTLTDGNGNWHLLGLLNEGIQCSAIITRSIFSTILTTDTP